MIEINTIKRHAQTDAIQFVKEASAEVEKALTSEIRLILKQQLAFKKETWAVIDEVKDC